MNLLNQVVDMFKLRIKLSPNCNKKSQRLGIKIKQLTEVNNDSRTLLIDRRNKLSEIINSHGAK